MEIFDLSVGELCPYSPASKGQRNTSNECCYELRHQQNIKGNLSRSQSGDIHHITDWKVGDPAEKLLGELESRRGESALFPSCHLLYLSCLTHTHTHTQLHACAFSLALLRIFFPTPTHVHTTFYVSVHLSLSLFHSLSLSPSLVIKMTKKRCQTEVCCARSCCCCCCVCVCACVRVWKILFLQPSEETCGLADQKKKKMQRSYVCQKQFRFQYIFTKGNIPTQIHVFISVNDISPQKKTRRSAVRN